MQQDVDSDRCESGDLENWLKLAQIPNFSVASLKKLKQKCDVGLSELFAKSKTSLEEIGFNHKQVEIILHPDKSILEASFLWLNKADNRFLLHFEHPSYPNLLKHISSPPPLLYGYGDPKHLNDYQIAIVESRAPSPQ